MKQQGQYVNTTTTSALRHQCSATSVPCDISRPTIP